jgi:hypothetical protein
MLEKRTTHASASLTYVRLAEFSRRLAALLARLSVRLLAVDGRRP